MSVNSAIRYYSWEGLIAENVIFQGDASTGAHTYYPGLLEKFGGPGQHGILSLFEALHRVYYGKLNGFVKGQNRWPRLYGPTGTPMGGPAEE